MPAISIAARRVSDRTQGEIGELCWAALRLWVAWVVLGTAFGLNG